MKLKDLVAQFREDTDDFGDLNGRGQLFQNKSIVRWLAEAEAEAAIRKRLLFDDYTLDLTEISVGPGQIRYTLDSRLFEVTEAWIARDGATQSCRLVMTDRRAMDANRPYWRTDTGQPQYAIFDDTSIMLPYKLNANYTVRLQGYRTPLEPLALENMESQSPEIAPVHHRFLVHWALHRGYSRPDSEVYDPKRADRALADFEAYFGYRNTANQGLRNQTDRPHHTRAYF